MNTITDRISSALEGLSGQPADVDLTSIAALLSDIRETIGHDLNRVTAEKSLSQPGAASNDEQQKCVQLEQQLSQFKNLFEHLKNSLIGKVEILYKTSPLKSGILSDISNPGLSIAGFLKMQSQIEYQFNNTWFQERPEVVLSKNQITNPANYKSGGIPWHRA